MMQREAEASVALDGDTQAIDESHIEPMLSSKEAAQLAHVERGTIGTWVKRGYLHPVLVKGPSPTGKQNRIRRSELEAFLESRNGHGKPRRKPQRRKARGNVEEAFAEVGEALARLQKVIERDRIDREQELKARIGAAITRTTAR